MVLVFKKWWRHRWLRLVVTGIGFWFALFFTFAMASMLDRYNSGREFDHWQVLKLYAIGFGHWMLLTPPIHYWSGTPRFVDASFGSKFLQSILMLIASLLVLIAYLLVIAAPVYGDPFDEFLESIRYEQWLWDLVLYVVVLMFGYQTAVLRRSREARLRAAELGKQLAEQQASLSAREAEYLRGRLGSHFVMNALSNLVGLMRLGQVRRAEEATILLSDILRNMTGGAVADECIPVHEELEDARQYLNFQKIRFPDLDIDFSMTGAARDVPVPRQILQPILENVFKHGPRGAVKIQVAAETQDGRLHLEVCNNMDSETADTTSDGEGMQLTKLRLDSVFGDECTIHRGASGGSYTVVLTMPDTQNGGRG